MIAAAPLFMEKRKSLLFGVESILHGKRSAENMVVGEIGALTGRSSRDRGDLADSLGSVGDAEELFLFDIDRMDLGNLVGS